MSALETVLAAAEQPEDPSALEKVLALSWVGSAGKSAGSTVRKSAPRKSAPSGGAGSGQHSWFGQGGASSFAAGVRHHLHELHVKHLEHLHHLHVLHEEHMEHLRALGEPGASTAAQHGTGSKPKSGGVKAPGPVSVPGRKGWW